MYASEVVAELAREVNNARRMIVKARKGKISARVAVPFVISSCSAIAEYGTELRKIMVDDPPAVPEVAKDNDKPHKTPPVVKQLTGNKQ